METEGRWSVVTCVGVDYCYIIASEAVFVLGVLGVALFCGLFISLFFGFVLWGDLGGCYCCLFCGLLFSRFRWRQKKGGM